jgi:hypothetical protein
MKRTSKKGGALTLEDLREGEKASDRRREPRITRERDIDILSCSTPQNAWGFQPVHMFDCSRYGIGVLCDRPVKRGEEFLVKLKIPRTMLVLYQVCHCEKIADGRFKVGANMVEFVCTPAQVLDALLAEDAPQPPTAQSP